MSHVFQDTPCKFCRVTQRWQINDPGEAHGASRPICPRKASWEMSGNGGCFPKKETVELYVLGGEDG